MIDVIKEYLVSLGMKVDKDSFQEASDTMQAVEDGAKKFFGTAAKGFAIAGTAITGAMVGATTGIYAFLSSLANADLANEQFARRMGMSKDATEELNKTLKAMGVTIEDLYLNPGLMNDFKTLLATIKDIRPPAEFKEQIKFIQSIQFELQQLKLSGSYALQWIGYYLFKYMEGPLKRTKNTLQDVNKKVTKDMPHWTKNVAQAISWVGRLGFTIVKAGTDLYTLFSKLGEKIPQEIKVIGAALLGLGLILRTGPLGIAFTLLTSILLLLDDFYTYLEGGESAFGPFWKRLLDFVDLLKNDGTIKRFGENLQNVFGKIGTGVQDGLEWIERLYRKFDDNGTLDNFKDGIATNFGTATQIIKDFGTWVGEVFDDLNEEGTLSGLEESFVGLGKEISEIYKEISKFVEKLYGIEETQVVLEWIGDFLEGKLKFALQTINETIKAVTFSLKSARAFITGDDALMAEAKREFFEEDENPSAPERSSTGYKRLPREALWEAKEQGSKTQDARLESSINSLPRGLEPSFKKALNDSDLVKGFRTFNQDLNDGFTKMAMMINPEAFQQYEAMASGIYANSYMYNTTSSSKQTLIYNTSNPVFNIASSQPREVAREVNNQWDDFNLNQRSMRNPY
ncbi:hypothetical protein J31TS6_22400 [Brevibacillus reuszeri]|uniref:hypothetical protein n=1 Tax=Brevibacillus reuszeri TaxID=54915 RepID=UPI001AFE9328|nr:hypothetical protein [Brevibacillus reuszeri]GIO06212.1 hypothetical protein J31TS6_22400 [Brevibacillus reuszeri]